MSHTKCQDLLFPVFHHDKGNLLFFFLFLFYFPPCPYFEVGAKRFNVDLPRIHVSDIAAGQRPWQRPCSAQAGPKA